MLKVTVKQSGPGFKAYIPKVQDAEAEGPAEAAEFCADEWRAHVPEETGAFKAGIYVRTHDQDGYGAAVSAAQSKRPGVQVRPPLIRPARKGAAVVGSVVPYDIHNELGTSTMPARPAFVPAVEKTKRQFPEIMRQKLRP